jgi:hypothetical protein
LLSETNDHVDTLRNGIKQTQQTYPFVIVNEYEQLVKGARLSGRSKLNFLRYAMLKLTKELQQEV